MGETADRIMDEIEQARKALDRDLAAFERGVKQETDWKVQFDRHPWAVLGAAFVLGFLLWRLVRS